MLYNVASFEDCFLTCADLDVHSQTASTLAILSVVFMTSIVCSGFCCLLFRRMSDPAKQKSGMRTHLRLHSTFDLLFLIWYMILTYTLRFSVLEDCYTCQVFRSKVYLGIMRMGKSVLLMLRNWTAVWIGFQRYLIVFRPGPKMVPSRGAVARFLRRPACRGAIILTIVLILNVSHLLDYLLQQCKGEDRLVLLRKLHILSDFAVIIVFPLLLFSIFSQRIVAQTRKAIGQNRLPAVTAIFGGSTGIRSSCLHVNRVLVGFMVSYVVLTVPALWYVIFYLLRVLTEDDCRSFRAPSASWIIATVCSCLISTTDFVIYFLFWPVFRRRAITFARACCKRPPESAVNDRKTEWGER